MPNNAWVKISARKRTAYMTRKLRYYALPRQAHDRARVQQSRPDTELRVKRNDTQTATARWRSFVRKYTDGGATTWRYDGPLYTSDIRTYKITYPRPGQRPRQRRRKHQNIFTRYAHICNVRETRRNFELKQTPKTNFFKRNAITGKTTMT